MQKFLTQMCHWFFLGIDWFCRILLSLEVVIITYVVITRYIFRASPAWGDELARLLLIWFGLICAVYALRTDSHARITILDKLLPARGAQSIWVINQTIILLFSIFMIVYGTKIVFSTRRAILPAMGIARSWLYLPLPITGIAYLMTIVEKIAKRMEKNE